MTETSDIAWGQFTFDEGNKALLNVLSGQTIRLKEQSAENFNFEYSDGEVQVPLTVEQRDRQLFVDFRRPEMRAVAQTYGLWRRMTFFLPDSLAFWFFGGREPLQPWRRRKVTLVGGWENARWVSSLLIESYVFHPPDARFSGGSEKTVMQLSALDRLPTRWRFVNARKIAPEVKLVTIPGGEIPFLDRAVPIGKQIAEAPRFVREDGDAFLFHRFVNVNFHRGENYDPVPYYGYINRHVALTLYAQSNTGVRGYVDPILVSWNAAPKDYFSRRTPVGEQTFLTPSLGLREELFFAFIDINGLRLEVGKKLPIIQERNPEDFEYFRKGMPEDAHHWNGIMFGAHLNAIDDLPMRSPAGLAKTSFGRAYRAVLGRSS